MLLVHHDEDVFTKLDETIQQQLLDESMQLTHQLNASGQYLSASPLHPAATAAVVRVRGGRESVTDGPFAETKEQLAGYFLINARDLNEAVRHRHSNPRSTHWNGRSAGGEGGRRPTE